MKWHYKWLVRSETSCSALLLLSVLSKCNSQVWSPRQVPGLEGNRHSTVHIYVAHLFSHHMECGVAQWYWPLPVPWHSHWGLWIEGYRSSLFSAWMLPDGGSEWSFSQYVVSVSKKPGCSSLGKDTDPGVIQVFIFTLTTVWQGKDGNKYHIFYFKSVNHYMTSDVLDSLSSRMQKRPVISGLFKITESIWRELRGQDRVRRCLEEGWVAW